VIGGPRLIHHFRPARPLTQVQRHLIVTFLVFLPVSSSPPFLQPSTRDGFVITDFECGFFDCRSALLTGLGHSCFFAPAALQLVPYCRFGNNVVQLIRALYYAEALDVGSIYIIRHFLFLNRPVITTRGIAVHPSKPPRRLAVLRHRFYVTESGSGCLPISPFAMAATFREHIIEQLPRHSSTATHAHVRSGDIFHRNIHSAYGQPPCGYYVEAVAIENATEVRVIAEDMRNPCVAAVCSRTGAVWKRQQLRDDLAAVLWAKSVVLARGTFGLAVLYLSQRKKTVYTFATAWEGLGRHMDCQPTEEYAAKVLGNWARTHEQLRLMVNGKCKKWTLVTR
jgi:hypothetical protein